MLEHRDIRPDKGEPSNNENKTKPKKRRRKKRSTIQRIKDYLDEHYELRINTLTQEVEYRTLENTKFQTLCDRKYNSLFLDINESKIQTSDSMLIKIMNSDYTPTYHPIRNYFDTLPPYDGNRDYIRELAETVVVDASEMEDQKLQYCWYEYLKKWLVGNAATCLGFGSNQTCLILVGKQGIGKTRWLNKLCPQHMQDFLVCSHINPSLTDKNTANYLAEKWFVNIDDQLETIFGRDFNSMKAIITAPFVTNRKVWQKLSKTRPRICSFMGSVNNAKFLSDTENRRYIVFTASKIDHTHGVEMDKVWSQARHLALNKYPYWFTTQEMANLNKLNGSYMQTTEEEDWLFKLYRPADPNDPKAMFLMTSEILSQLNAHSGLKLNLRRLSRALERLDFGPMISKRFKDKGCRRVYSVIITNE